ncbi:MAG: sensor hybrid histidine kinase [Mucilaginibacter sp.]|nr:sensor hybrid histidine kinase [Mucilaginibacter sp.]
MEQNDKAVVLIVDDKEANLFALEQLLINKDRIILRAINGRDALEIALSQSVDLVILDVRMPEMDGFEVAQILQSTKKTRDIPIIFASAERTEHHFMIKGFEEGAIDYLFKPLDPEIVKAKVNVHLKIQLQKRELMDKNLSLRKSALLINNSADIIGIIDAESFKIEEINEAFTTILGYADQETLGTSMTCLLVEEDQAGFNKLVKQTKEHFAFDTRVYCKDRSVKWLQWKVVVRDQKWFVNARDITGQKIAEQQVQQLNKDLQDKVAELITANKELESFSYSVSHDLRAPLRALEGYSKIFEEDHVEILNEDAKRLLAEIKYNAKKMGALIDDLLSFSRLGRQAVKKQQLHTPEIVERIIAEINHSAPLKATIKFNELPVTYADPSLIYQVWLNLISNAIKYSQKKERPEIEIGGTEAENETTFYIKDNGAGFDMRYAGRLFGVFERLHDSDEFEGTGIGLAIVQRIIARHGGSIRAEGKVDQGAVFYFTLPRIAGKHEKDT